MYLVKSSISTYRGYFFGYLRFIIELQRKRLSQTCLIENISFILLISHAFYLQVFHITGLTVTETCNPSVI